MLLRHTAFNLFGFGTPLLAAVVCVPILISHLGVERFGMLALLWTVVSYFGLFDFGLGRALTQELAILFSAKTHTKIGTLIGTALASTGMLGAIAGLLLAWGVDSFAGQIYIVPDKNEAVSALYAIAVALPFIVITAALRGILEARHAFGIVNLIRTPFGLFNFVGPAVLVIYTEARLDSIAWLLAGGRVVCFALYAVYAYRVLPRDARRMEFKWNSLRRLIASGGWLTVSNVVSPFMGYVDRFVIGALLSTAAVSYYATPNELVTKLWIIPGAVTSVLFPTFAAKVAERSADTKRLFDTAIHWLFAALLPITVALALFARELLTVWIGEDFAAHSARVLQIFAIGIFINCLAHVPFTLIQSAGRARITALIHAAELPLFLALLWWITKEHGVMGAAFAWLVRMVVDAALMFTVCQSTLGQSGKELISRKVFAIGLLTAVAFGGILISPIGGRAMWVLGVTLLVCLSLIPRTALAAPK